MLDNANYIAQKDTADALGLAAIAHEQLRHGFSIPLVTPKTPIQNIVLAGMGGSALQAASECISKPIGTVTNLPKLQFAKLRK